MLPEFVGYRDYFSTFGADGINDSACFFTVPNTSNVTRYSIDFRTVHLDDVLKRKGAPNVDSACTGTTMGDYLRGTDLSHLPEDAISLYLDGTEIQYAKS